MSKVLIIDDDPTFCLMLKSFLNKKGFNAHEVHNARQSIKAIQQEDFDIILTDFRLPDINGLDLLKSIKTRLKQQLFAKYQTRDFFTCFPWH